MANRLHPLLTPEARPDVEIPLAAPRAPRQFRLPSCIGRPIRSGAGRQDPIKIESEIERRQINLREFADPTRTSAWFAAGDAASAAAADITQPNDLAWLDELTDPDRANRMAWKLALLVLVLAGVALLSVVWVRAA